MRHHDNSTWRSWRGRPTDSWADAPLLAMLAAAGIYRPRAGEPPPSDDEILAMVGANASAVLRLLHTPRRDR